MQRVLMTPSHALTGTQTLAIRVTFGGCQGSPMVGLAITIPVGLQNVQFAEAPNWQMASTLDENTAPPSIIKRDAVVSKLNKRQIALAPVPTAETSAGPSLVTFGTKVFTVIPQGTGIPSVIVTSKPPPLFTKPPPITVTATNEVSVTAKNNRSTVTIGPLPNLASNVVSFTGYNMDPSFYQDFFFNVTIPSSLVNGTLFFFPVLQICANESIRYSNIPDDPWGPPSLYDAPRLVISVPKVLAGEANKPYGGRVVLFFGLLTIFLSLFI
ncbi:hypothetical protein HDU92_003701 [Lobulomyces angularis]|nr:hypothetical protein HDU92_003701 [Lobulomyces angularis]